ncbi:hypothetical protein CRENPOLYSF1_920006 [Crenothrix polyspora]|uniref:Uncharacterized protein n=1 Tax=Crenothrix polyspora TaxID=360316 RepID=A0A1R4HJZ6_9GAMM|nr:hypothetical protein CRENPOLYSF1_920006 [Crenothrix polyspora]
MDLLAHKKAIGGSINGVGYHCILMLHNESASGLFLKIHYILQAFI